MANWENFVELFNDWFVSLSARMQIYDKFIKLEQGEKLFMQYKEKLTTLSRYAHQLISIAKEKIYKFFSILKDLNRQLLVP